MCVFLYIVQKCITVVIDGGETGGGESGVYGGALTAAAVSDLGGSGGSGEIESGVGGSAGAYGDVSKILNPKSYCQSKSSNGICSHDFASNLEIC